MKKRTNAKCKKKINIYEPLKNTFLMENSPCEYRFPGGSHFVKCPFFEKCKKELLACKIFEEFAINGNLALNWSHPPTEKIYNKLYNVKCLSLGCKSKAVLNGKCSKCLKMEESTSDKS